MIFDSHAHYNDTKFDEYENGREALLNRLFSENVGYIINASVSPDDARNTLRLCDEYDNIYACVGIHPEESLKIYDIYAAVHDIETLASHRKAVAIGEIGLDYYWEPYDSKKQTELFIAQLELARKLHMPAVIHDRDAHGDTESILRAYKDVPVMLHSFSGSAEWANELVRDGRYISFSGVVTFKNARRAVEAAEAVPLDRLLIETDAPYLAPTPLRGSVNHSGNLVHTAAKIAEIKKLSVDEIIEITHNNALKFFGIDKLKKG